MPQLPPDCPFSSRLFWDIHLPELDLEQHKAFIVGRVLDYGHWKDWLFIRKYYGIEGLK